MMKCVGLWVDNAGSLVVFFRNGKTSVKRIESNVEGHFRLSGGSRSATPYGPQEVTSETRVERRRGQQFRRYYDRVIEAIRGADAILLVGPGEARIHLAKQIRESKDLGPRLQKVEPADKMTERQFVAKVKAFFSSEFES